MEELTYSELDINPLLAEQIKEVPCESGINCGDAVDFCVISDILGAAKHIFSETQGMYAKPFDEDLILFIGITNYNRMSNAKDRHYGLALEYLKSTLGKSHTGIKEVVVIPELDNKFQGFILAVDFLNNKDVAEFSNGELILRYPKAFLRVKTG